MSEKERKLLLYIRTTITMKKKLTMTITRTVIKTAIIITTTRMTSTRK